uniref:Secreted protein n=1 Tax=Colobus angolensis palliatus TaxID=336983 RepID=A0A2K5HMU8_COLAP
MLGQWGSAQHSHNWPAPSCPLLVTLTWSFLPSHQVISRATAWTFLRWWQAASVHALSQHLKRHCQPSVVPHTCNPSGRIPSGQEFETSLANMVKPRLY